MNFYNEIDRGKAQWLRELIKRNVITEGTVDERSIEQINPDELLVFTQCHFFAGIGIWSYALRLARWPDDREVWTGSCPCQPFSVAGKRKAEADERHLWPAWFRLITERRPVTLFSEQVSDGDGQTWLDTVQLQMESVGYRFGSLTLPAASVGAPHGRHRTFFVADARQERIRASGPGSLESETGTTQRGKEERERIRPDSRECSPTGNLADAKSEGFQKQFGNGKPLCETKESIQGETSVRRSPVNGFWSDAEWLWCKDNKYRAAKPGTFPLAHGAAARVLRLRGYGDGIVAQVAQEFIQAYLEIKASENNQLTECGKVA